MQISEITKFAFVSFVLAGIASHSVNTRENIVKQSQIDAKRVHEMKWATNTLVRKSLCHQLCHRVTHTDNDSVPERSTDALVRSGQRNCVFA